MPESTVSPPVRILAIDDEELLREYYRRLLSNAGYEIDTAETAEVALLYLEQETYDLILLDLRMPGMGGIELLRRLWHRRNRYPSDVLVISGYATLDDTVEIMKKGASGVIAKSYVPEELLTKVVSLLDARRDPLIAYIRNNPGEVTSREELARRFHISPGTASNRIKRHTSVSFSLFLQSCRIQEAQRLLYQTDLDAQQVAARVGFKTPQAFSRTFRRLTGRSPCQYRKEIHSIGT
jgi:YesN/AraC family two-component response regulator